ncbi:MAG: hypothetical protein JXR68_12145 [Bacteroidales bacterium]|nr:hypothetical protein [Bacteroidales bacterium]
MEKQSKPKARKGYELITLKTTKGRLNFDVERLNGKLISKTGKIFISAIVEVPILKNTQKKEKLINTDNLTSTTSSTDIFKSI